MFCVKCGSELEAGANFCAKCGAKVNAGSNVSIHANGNADQNDPKGKKPKLKKPLAIAAIIILVLLCGGMGYATLYLNMQKDKLASNIEESEIPEYTEQKNDAVRKWGSFGITDISAKKAVIHHLKVIEKDVDSFNKCTKEVKKMQEEKEQYRFDEESYENYEEALSECAQAVNDKEAGEALSLYSGAKKAFKDLMASNDIYIKDRTQMYQEVDMSEAEDKEVSGYKKNMENINKLVEKKDKDYGAIKKAFADMDQVIYMYIEPQNPLDITIQQVDATEFPKVKLYMTIKDPDTQEVPENLDQMLFYIKKQDANAKYVKQVVKAANQLNEKEALKVDMVADVSGSMDGTPIYEAKQIMGDFVNSVQFNAGDLVELTSFSTGVRLEQEFCGDGGLLIDKINNLAIGDMTSLYDALYTSVERVAAQTGARCVIAFTDGHDNYSNCTKDDVISVANRYHVPVFIIGIGDIDYSEASYIASQTGGAYYNVSDVNAMANIYEKIYEMEKQLYLVEFEDNTGSTVEDTSNIEAGYHSVEYGGECKYTYTPNILLSAKSSNIYNDGPEAVVEAYLRNFDDAVTNSDFSLISGCLKSGSPIYEEQEKYVQRDIKERVDSYELMDVTYSDDQNCVISTRETYYVQVAGKALQLMTQECKYALEKSGDKWEMTSFVDIKVVSRIKQ